MCERDGLLMWSSALGLVHITQVAGQGCVKRLKWGTGHQRVATSHGVAPVGDAEPFGTSDVF